MEVQTEQIKITTEFIKLQQLLKFSGAADIGSEAKDMIASGIVKVNGEVCTMRGKKLRPGDIAEINAEDIILRLEVI
ncbi:MAG: RNA-binding S4 domain-containing protein [Oscillospiraceae bacterium]|uniref:RNA-binding S4 domain-containing protein n=1 Tax=Huintestinicola sp. TaxID=2981661 RepID=UPI002A8AB9E3|nr:RNA-binding S4 domain-containing protein [Oscillospiraceae bacterium]MDY3791211.1 RNA-binding S4 domain-containing protein [Oscillospiraceae bacterium]MDY6207348.1 RNA-binding S4 domain-containing protein [Oscillospiraceae bacterium]